MRGLTVVGSIFICVMLFCGCGGGTATIETASNNASAPGSLAFPAPSELIRTASATTAERYAVGGQAISGLPPNRFSAEGAVGLFSPGYGGEQAALADAAYAGYLFELPEFDGPYELHMGWDTPPESADLWLGLGSFTGDSWKWFSPDEPGLLELDSPGEFFSPAGVFVAAVVVLGETEARLDYIGLGEPPAVWLVDASAPPGGDGLSWDTAFRDLDDALAVAQPQDEVWVAAGNYYPGSNQLSSFVIGESVSVYGGFAGTETERSQRDWETNPTVLSGNSPTRYHIVTTSAHSVLDGFTVYGGRAVGQWEGTDVGGGVLVKFAPVYIRNCSFELNGADNGGGAIYFEFGWSTEESQMTNCSFRSSPSFPAAVGAAIACLDSGPLAIEDCTFSNSSAGQGGAAVIVDSFGITFRGCTFEDNTASDSGGALNWRRGSGALIGCTFRGNSAKYLGGAVWADDAYIDVRDCLFEENQSEYHNGGAVNTSLMSKFAGCTFLRNRAMDGGALATSRSDTVLVNCRFLGNTAQDEGGAVYAYNSAWPVFMNCLYAGNTAATAGGGIYAKGESDFSLINSTLTANIAGQGGALYSDNSRPWIANTVLYGNDCLLSGPEVFATGSYTPSWHCCDIAGSGGSGAGWDFDIGHDRDGNIDATPLFAQLPNPGTDAEWGTEDDYYGQLWLTAGSPCIDAGDNSDMTEFGIEYDLAQLFRFVDDPLTDDTGYGEPPLIDIGAYEFQGE